MTVMTALRSHRHETYGVLTVTAFLAIVALVIAAYLHAFTPYVRVTVQAERAGLLLQKDSDVTMHSVTIGKVGTIAPDGPQGALIQLLIQPEQTQFIPANAEAQLIAPTVFGPKYVDLVQPRNPTQRRLSTGDVITQPQVEVEANTVFDQLIGLLQTIDPAKLDSALGALSTSLQGRGDRLGQFLSDLNRYLTQLNTGLPELRADLATAPGVLNNFADVSPDLVRIVGNLTVTSNTIVQEKPTLDAFIAHLSTFSGTAQSFLEENERPLTQALSVLRPTTALLARYSPMFPCLFHSANVLRTYTEQSFGGTEPGLRTLTTFLPGQSPYLYPQNLPKLGIDAPGCYGGAPGPGQFPRHQYFDDGSPRLDTKDNPPTIGNRPLAQILFGQLAPSIPAPVAAAAAPLTAAVPGLGAPASGGGR